MSIATKTGDKGTTALIGGARVSKADVRVEAYGNVDELGAAIGFARSICRSETTRTLAQDIQKDLFAIGGSLANPESDESVSNERIDALTAEVNRIESIDGILRDWSLSGEDPCASAFDLARAICRRAERGVVRLRDAGEAVEGKVVPYLNRLADLLWLIGREIEHAEGKNSALRDPDGGGGNWTRAW